MFPNVEFPVVTVTTIYPGASPETVEREVTKKIEEAINTVEGVRHIESTSQEGLSNIVVSSSVGVSTQIASQDIRGKVAAIRGELPREIEEPIVQRIDSGALPIVSVGVDAPGLTPQAATDIADKLVKKRLENVPGVGAGRPRRRERRARSRSWSTALKLEAYHISLARGRDAPRGARTSTCRPATPTAARPRRWCAWRPAAAAPPRSREIPVKRAGRHGRLRARRRAGGRRRRGADATPAFLDERPALALDVAEAVGRQHRRGRRRRPRRGREAGEGAAAGRSRCSVIKDDSQFIRESIEDVNTTILIGGLLTVFIVFLFLNSWRSTVITGLTLPISVVAAFIAMRVFGFTLNVMTLMGLSLAIGMLIDDAIVVRENIVRHMQRGKDHFDAARDGTAEIGLAVMATTFTIIAVFMPVAFMGGMVGQFFYEFGITVAAAVLVSLFVSFTLDPMLSSRWVDPDVEQGTTRTSSARVLARFNQWFDSCTCSYERLLGWCAAPPLAVVGGRARRVPRELPDPGDAGRRLHARLQPRRVPGAFKATPGATLRETRQRAPAMVRRAQEAARRRVHLHDDRRGRHHPPAGDRGRHLRQAEGPARARPSARCSRDARRAVAEVPGLTYGFTEAGRLRPEADADQRARRRGRRARPHLARADAGDGEDPRRRRHRDEPGEGEARAARAQFDRERASDLGMPSARSRRRCARRSPARWRRRSRTRPATTTTCACGCAPTSAASRRTCSRSRVPTDKDDDSGDKILVPLAEVATCDARQRAPRRSAARTWQREVRVSAANTDGGRSAR